MSENLTATRRQLLRAAARAAKIILHSNEEPPAGTAAKKSDPIVPLGTLILIGGGYPPVTLKTLKERLPQLSPDECDPIKIYRQMLACSHKKAPIVEIITNASELYATETAEEHTLLMKHLGAGEIHTTTTRDAAEISHDKAFLERLKHADIIYFTGGAQEDLYKIYSNTPIPDILRNRYQQDKDFVLAGSSAGAMIMAQKAINGNNKEMEGGCPPIIDGFAILAIIVETHMNSLNRKSHERRLLHAISQHPQNIGIGLDNATAVVISNGQVTPYGNGRVLLAFHRDCAINIAPGNKVEVATLRECADFAQAPLSAHCFQGKQTFHLGNFNYVPGNISLKSKPIARIYPTNITII